MDKESLDFIKSLPSCSHMSDEEIQNFYDIQVVHLKELGVIDETDNNYK